jgi:hypothetical protein
VLDAGLLLFAAFVVRALVEDGSADAGAAASGAYVRSRGASARWLSGERGGVGRPRS